MTKTNTTDKADCKSGYNDESNSEKNSKVMIVDDHPIIRQGLRELIDQEPHLTVCGECDNATEALKIIKKVKPDIAIIDISLNKDMSGLDLIKDIKHLYPNLLTLVLSMHDESVFAERVLRAGGRGYVMKEQGTEQVITAIHKILDGEIFLNQKVADKILNKIAGIKSDTSANIDNLTDRELEVYQFIGRGLSTREIADKLFLSGKTIEAHRTHIREKLKLKNAAELLQHAIQWSQNEFR